MNINGRQQPLSGSFTVSPAQPATTAPELVSTLPSGHRLESSGGSLVKVCPQTLTSSANPTCSGSGSLCAQGLHGWAVSVLQAGLCALLDIHGR